MGIGLRGAVGAQHTMQTYGETGSASAGDFASGVVGMEIGTAQSARNIFSGNGTAMDFIGLALWFTPVHKAAEEAKPTETKPTEEAGAKTEGVKTEETPKINETAPVEKKAIEKFIG